MPKNIRNPQRAIQTGLLLAVLAGVFAGSAAAENTVSINFSAETAIFQNVTSSADLVNTLHHGLQVKASSPLDFEVVVHLVGHVYQNRDQQPHPAESGIYFDLTAGQPASGLLKELRFYTFGDFNENEAWAHFQEQIQSALLYSMNSSGAFEAEDSGIVPLTVASVVDGGAPVQADGRSMVLELTAEVLYRDGSKFGSRSPPDGYIQQLGTLQLLLSPEELTGETAAEHSSAVMEPPPGTVTGAGEMTGVTGLYGIGDGGMLIERIDGKLYLSNPGADASLRFELEPIEDQRYDVNYRGTAMQLKFSVDDKGDAFAITLIQGEHEMKLPRKN